MAKAILLFLVATTVLVGCAHPKYRINSTLYIPSVDATAYVVTEWDGGGVGWLEVNVYIADTGKKWNEGTKVCTLDEVTSASKNSFPDLVLSSPRCLEVRYDRAIVLGYSNLFGSDNLIFLEVRLCPKDAKHSLPLDSERTLKYGLDVEGRKGSK